MPTTISPTSLSANRPSSTDEQRAFGPAAFRQALGRFATGVTLVTAADASGPIGLVVNAFTSVSLEPPLVAICPSRSSFTWSRMRHRSRFGINVLAAEHAAYVRRAANPEADRFAGLDYELSASGVPRVGGAVAFLECEPVSEYCAGDHWIVVARVHDLHADHAHAPLVFSDGELGSFVSPASTLSSARRPSRRQPRPLGPDLVHPEGARVSDTRARDGVRTPGPAPTPS